MGPQRSQTIGSCRYTCQNNGGCQVRDGGTLGSCFPDSFGGSCSGIPRGCRNCNQILSCPEGGSSNFGGSSSFGGSSGGGFGGSSSFGSSSGGGGSSCSKTDSNGTTTTLEITVKPEGNGTCSETNKKCTKTRRGQENCISSISTGGDCTVPRCTI